jgi:translation initiation factor 1
MSRLFSGTQFDRPAKCDQCGQHPDNCRCIKSSLPPKKTMGERAGKRPPAPTGYALDSTNSDPPKDQKAKVSLERRKGGRDVSVISGLEHPANDLPALCAKLKNHLGAGGSVQGRTIEIQGDHATKIRAYLTTQNIAVRNG